MLIENVFGIVSSSKNYLLTLEQFDFIVKHILETKYNVDSNFLEIRIDYIQNETVLVFSEENRDDVSMKIIGDKFTFSNEKKIKKKILTDIFSDKLIYERVIYNELRSSRIKVIEFTVKENIEPLSQNIQIINSSNLDKINSQIKVLTEKKIEIIRNNKR